MIDQNSNAVIFLNNSEQKRIDKFQLQFDFTTVVNFFCICFHFSRFRLEAPVINW